MTDGYIWSEKLGCREIVLFSLLRLASGRTIFYQAQGASRNAVRLLNFAKKYGFLNHYEPFETSLEKKSAGGRVLNYEINGILRGCINSYMHKNLPDEPLRFRNMISCHISHLLFRKIAFITAVRYRIDSEDRLKQGRHTVYLSRTPFFRQIAGHDYGHGLLIRQSLFSMECVSLYARPLLVLIYCFLKKVIPTVHKDRSVVRPSVWIEYAHKDIVDYASWSKFVKDSNFDIVYYLDRPDTPANAEMTGEIERRGFKWIDAHFFSLLRVCSRKSLRLKNILTGLKGGRCHSLWSKLVRIEYNFYYQLYRAIFERFNVKILFQHQDTSWRQEIQARAVEDAGGMMLGFHWSNYPCIMTPTHLFPNHIFFVWGNMFHDLMRRRSQDHTCRHLLPIGLPLLNDEQDTEPFPLADNIGFRLAIFDSSASAEIHQTPETLSLFLMSMLELLAKNPTWGAVIKSKSLDMSAFGSLPRGGEIREKFDRLSGERRLSFLKTRVSPIIVARKVDLCVCYGLNSAGIVAAAGGAPAIHWDCSGWLFHPFYKDPGQKILFRTLKEMEDAVTRASKGDSSIGDFSRWRKSFNYFMDENSPRRLGKFIQDFIAEVTRTNEPFHSMDWSADNYMNENRIGEDFFASGNHWDDEHRFLKNLESRIQ